MDAEIEAKARMMLGAFLDRRYKAIKDISLENLDLNPFLLRLMGKPSGLEDAESVVRWALQQRVERGTVTSFGMLIQNIAKLFSSGTGVEGADISKNNKGKMYYIQVKSGPNTVNKDIASEITKLLRSANRRDPGSVSLLGMCYGKKGRVSSIIKKYVEVDTIIGRDFWGFISGDPRTYREVFGLMESVAANHKVAGGKTYNELYEEKVSGLVSEFKSVYGASGPKMWRNLLDKNM